MKIDLDKYYTPKELALRLYETTKSIIGGENISEYVEPSAGSGAFSNQIPNCKAFDLQPEHPSIVEQDFLTLQLEYKVGRCVIGNPPFGNRNSLSVKFFKKAVELGDYVAFILPISQFNNNQQMYEFDMIYSEDLGAHVYSGVNLHCCFNIYKRPPKGLNKSKKKYETASVIVSEYRRGGNYPLPVDYDLGICGWGTIGKKVDSVGQYAQEIYIKVEDKSIKDYILQKLIEKDWGKEVPSISSPKLQTWRVRKYISEIIHDM